MRWFPDSLSFVGVVMLVAGFAVFLTLFVTEYLHNGVINWQLAGLVLFTIWAVTGIDPGKFFRRNGSGQ